MLLFHEDRTAAVLFIMFAVWAAVVIALLMYYLLRTTSMTALRQAADSPQQYTRITMGSGAGSGSVKVTDEKGVINDCPVLIGSRKDPQNASNRGMLVCFGIGQFADVTQQLTFRPRFIKVAHGYTLLAFGDKYFGEPLQYRLRGPNELSVQSDAWTKDIRSIIVHMNITPAPVIKPCRVAIKPCHGDELCLAEGTHVKLGRSNNKQDGSDAPREAVVQRGFRAKLYALADLAGDPVADVVGPATIPGSACSTSAASAASARQWKSANIVPCGVTLYSEPGFSGEKVCTRASVPELGFVPKSMHVANACRVQAMSKPGMNGNVLWTTDGSAKANHEELPSERQRLPWQSLRISCGQLEADLRARGKTISSVKSGSPDDVCVTFKQDNGKGVCLTLGVYKDIAGVLGFKPSSLQIPPGVRIIAFNRVDERIFHAFGPRVLRSVAANDWFKVQILSLPPLPWQR